MTDGTATGAGEEDACLFERALGTRFNDLPHAVRKLHAVAGKSHWQGRARVTRGGSRIGGLVCRIVGFPPEADDVPVSVTIEPREGTEVWNRDFGGRTFASILYLRDTEQRGHISERFGVMAFDIDLRLVDGRLHFPVTRGSILGIPLPKVFLPISEAGEFEKEGRFHFDVQLSLPGIGALVRYQGHLDPVQPDV